DAPMHLVTKGTKSGRAVLVCSNARRGVGGCRYASWHYPLTERFIIETLEELDLRELFPSIYKTTETTLQALTKAKAESARVVELLVSRPTSEALLARLDEAEKAVRTLTEEVQRLAQDTAAEARKLKDAERDHHDARTAMKELRRVHRSRDARAIFDLRVRLHQLLRRTISAIKFTPARDREGPIQGDIVIEFQGADVVRIISVWRGMTEVESVRAVREGGRLKRLSETVYMSGRRGKLTRTRVDERDE
ncbi:MAG TPA: hypothetical protein VFB30_17430, partial [Spirochaetia bacterium]|nr:hypothetical protein [Spirochaetia bacterium]